MALWIECKTVVGSPYMVNFELVRHFEDNPDSGSTIHFDEGHMILVEDDAETLVQKAGGKFR